MTNFLNNLWNTISGIPQRFTNWWNGPQPEKVEEVGELDWSFPPGMKDLDMGKVRLPNFSPAPQRPLDPSEGPLLPWPSMLPPQPNVPGGKSYLDRQYEYMTGRQNFLDDWARNKVQQQQKGEQPWAQPSPGLQEPFRPTQKQQMQQQQMESMRQTYQMDFVPSMDNFHLDRPPADNSWGEYYFR